MKYFKTSILFSLLLIITIASQAQSNIDPRMRIQNTSIKNKFLDIPYATISPSQKLDIYLPNDGKGPFPVIVSIHGGGFVTDDKSSGQQLNVSLEGLKHGYAVVSINYRLSGEAKFPALIQDAKAAVRYIRNNAKIYNLDRDKIAAWGSSAGGYLASMLGTTGDIKDFDNCSLGNECLVLQKPYRF